MENKDKINFDTDFLEKNTKEKPKETPKSKDPNWVFHDGKSNKGKYPTPDSGGMSDNAKKWAWGIGIVVVISILSSLGGDSTNMPSPSVNTNNNGGVRVGQYMCSSYAASQADNMTPPSYEKSSLGTQSSELDSRSTTLDSEKNQIENEYVDNTDQYSLDTHNSKVDDYNSELQQYKNDVHAYDSDLASYNAKVDVYNSYLKNNCTPN